MCGKEGRAVLYCSIIYRAYLFNVVHSFSPNALGALRYYVKILDKSLADLPVLATVTSLYQGNECSGGMSGVKYDTPDWRQDYREHFIPLHWPDFVLPSTSLHYTALHWPCTALHSTALYCTAPHYSALHWLFNALQSTALHFTALHYTIQHCLCNALRCTAQFYSAQYASHLTVPFTVDHFTSICHNEVHCTKLFLQKQYICIWT